MKISLSKIYIIQIIISLGVVNKRARLATLSVLAPKWNFATNFFYDMIDIMGEFPYLSFSKICEYHWIWFWKMDWVPLPWATLYTCCTYMVLGHQLLV